MKKGLIGLDISGLPLQVYLYTKLIKAKIEQINIA